MREYREGFPKFLVLSILAFVAYLAGGWALWHFMDRGDTPPVAEGDPDIGGKFVRTQIGEEDIPAHSWSPWYEAPQRGVSVEMIPLQAEKIAKIEARWGNGTVQQIDGRSGKRGLSDNMVAARIWNGASSRVLARFFTWRPLEYHEGDEENGERLEKVTTLSLQPGQWSDWVVQPDGTAELVVQMDSYAEAVVKCALRLDDGTMQIVPAAERWTGQKVHGVRLRNDGANPITATVLAGRPLETASASSRQQAPAPTLEPASNPQPAPAPVPAPAPREERAERVPPAPSPRQSRPTIGDGYIERGERLETVAKLSLSPGQWSEWVVRPSGTSSMALVMNQETRSHLRCVMQFNDGTNEEFQVSDPEAWRRPAKALRLRNDTGTPFDVTVFAWRPLQATVHATPMQAAAPPANWQVVKVTSVVIPPYGNTGWIARPEGCWGFASAFSEPNLDQRFTGELRFADGNWDEVMSFDRARISQEVVAARVNNPVRDRPITVTFYTWCRR